MSWETPPGTRYFISDSGVMWLRSATERGFLSRAELEACWETEAQRDPNIFFSVFTYKSGMQHCRICSSPGSTCRYPEQHQQYWYASGIQLYPWQIEILRGDVYDLDGNPAHTIIVSGGPGCGKTTYLLLSSIFLGALNPGFRLMTAAPSQKQNTEIIATYDKLVADSPAAAFIKNVRRNPTPFMEIRQYNGSYDQILTTGVFSSMSDARSLLGFEVDVVRYDEAGSDPQFTETMAYLGSRTRGTRNDGTPRGVSYPDLDERVAQMTVYSNPNESSSDWDNFVDMARAAPGFAVYEVGMGENRAVTDEQARAIRQRLIVAATSAGKSVQDALDFMAGRQSSSIGGEVFSAAAMREVLDENYDITPYITNESGTNFTFAIPRQDKHFYIITCDPGTAPKPRRNAPAIMVFDVTSTPILVALYWGSDQPGRAAPALLKLEKWINEYDAFALVDTTGPQGILLEEHKDLSKVWDKIIGVAFGGRDSILDTLEALAGIVAVKRGFILPKYQPLQRQLKNYKHHASKGLAQDLVVCILLLVYWLRALYDGKESDDSEETDVDKIIEQRRQTFFDRHNAQDRQY